MASPPRACTIWFTGLSGSGKTTVSTLVAEYLKARGLRVELLDGDVVRTNLCKGLGFSKEDRDANVRRIGWVCELLTRNGVFVCAAAISPYDAVRREVRQQVGDLVLVYCRASLAVLEQRDVKGLYAKARQGLIKDFTGVSAPYEPPADHEVEICSDCGEAPEQSAAQVIRALQRLGYLEAQLPRATDALR